MAEIKPRIPPLPREEWTDAAREVFAFWGEPDAWNQGSKINISMVQANHPPLAIAYNTFGKHLLLHSTLPLRARELITLRVAWLLKCDYEWHYHVGYAVNLGMSHDEILAVKEGADAPNWNDDDKIVLQAVDELRDKSGLSDDLYAALSRQFNKQQMMDFVFTVGNYVMLSWSINVCGIQLEDRVDKVDYDLKTKSGAPLVGRMKPGETKDWTNNRG